MRPPKLTARVHQAVHASWKPPTSPNGVITAYQLLFRKSSVIGRRATDCTVLVDSTACAAEAECSWDGLSCRAACVCTRVAVSPTNISSNCTGKGLTSIPACVGSDTTALFVVIHAVCQSLFAHVSVCRYFGANSISLSSTTFNRFVNLTTLVLNDNFVLALPSGVFDSLLELRSLYDRRY